MLRDTAPGFQPFGFAGGLYDPDTGLVRFGVRDYDPAVGQWTSRDPILLRSGETNLYLYARNDPVNAIDPTGLYVESAIDLASIAYDLYALARDNIFGNCDNLGTNLLALGLDIVGLALPFVGGLGMAARMGRGVRFARAADGSREVYRFLSVSERAALDAGRGLSPRGVGGSIADQVAGRDTRWISASMSEAAARRFDNGMA